MDAIDRAAQQPLRAAAALALRPTVERLDAYLLAVRDLFADESLVVDDIAAERGLDARVLRAWGRRLTNAVDDDNDLFHAYAQAIATPDQVAEAPTASCDEVTPPSIEMIVDYSQLAPEKWLPDDVSYGLAPRSPGSVAISRGTTAPRIEFAERGAAVFDPAWDVRTLAAEHQLEPGAVGNVVRPGRTLYTPNFTVQGKVYVLVRGVGQVYATVDQHALIAGPLHGVLVGGLNTEGAWRWVERDLSEYGGRTAHLEFTPAKEQTIEVSAVAQGATPPAPLEDSLAGLVPVDASATPDSMAAALRNRFAALLARLEDARAIDEEHAAHDARLANWALANPSLFTPDPDAAFAPVAALADDWKARRAQVLARIKTESRLCMAMQDNTGVDEHVFLRGSWKNLGVATPRRGLEALYGDAPLATGSGSGRLELARQLTDAKANPLLPRVMVNRVWHHLFGRGIVASVDNFGVMGDMPTHPELLDYLSTKFIHDGWSIKRLIRELTLSSTYRLASGGETVGPPSDPQNLLLSRARVRRLEGEAIRDAMLQISGSLDRRPYGRSVPTHLDSFMEGRGRPENSGPLDGANRRSIYLEVRRNFPSPMMLAFDTPIPFSTVGRRSVSNVPAQSLVMLNDPLVHELSSRWAQTICSEVEGNADRIGSMYEECFGRSPTDSERAQCEAFVNEAGENAWKDLAHALWNVKEFVFVN